MNQITGLFSTDKSARNTDKSKFTYNGWGIAFDGRGMWDFGNSFARNVLIFGIDNTSFSCTCNQKLFNIRQRAKEKS